MGRAMGSTLLMTDYPLRLLVEYLRQESEGWQLTKYIWQSTVGRIGVGMQEVSQSGMYSQGGLWVPAVITSAPCARCKVQGKRPSSSLWRKRSTHTHKLGLGIGRFQCQAVWGQFYNGSSLKMEIWRILVVATFAKVPQGVKQQPNTQPQAQECHPQQGGRISNWQKVSKRLAITEHDSAMNSKIFIRPKQKALKEQGQVIR